MLTNGTMLDLKVYGTSEGIYSSLLTLSYMIMNQGALTLFGEGGWVQTIWMGGVYCWCSLLVDYITNHKTSEIYCHSNLYQQQREQI